MKTLFLLFIFYALTLRAQITITNDDMPSAGNTFTIANALPDQSIDLNETGADHTWDYSSLAALSSMPDTFIDSHELPALLQLFFSASNLADKSSLNISFGQFSLQDVYSVYKNSSSQYELDGYAGTFDGIPIPAAYSAKDILYRFPLNYGNRDSGDASLLFYFPGLIYFSQNRHRVNEVDGWGSIQTPSGTYDALRVKSTITDVDSFYVDTLKFGSKVKLKSYEYKWLAAKSGIPVLEIVAQDASGTPVISGIMYREQSISSVANAVLVMSLKIFPDPASSYLHIKLPEPQPATISVYDETGELKMEDEIYSADYVADVSKWRSGLYWLRIIQHTKSYAATVLIEK